MKSSGHVTCHLYIGPYSKRITKKAPTAWVGALDISLITPPVLFLRAYQRGTYHIYKSTDQDSGDKTHDHHSIRIEFHLGDN